MGPLAARWQHRSWQPPELHHYSLALLAFLPQFFAFYLPATRNSMSATLAAACLVGSQLGLLLFCLLNRQRPWILLLAAGLALNLLVIAANGGFMPLSLQAAERLIPNAVLQNMAIGGRIGPSSKDILLPYDRMVFPWLSDRFLPPTWFPYQFAFSAGDILISLGAFLLLGTQPGFLENRQKGNSTYVNRPSDKPTRHRPGETL